MYTWICIHVGCQNNVSRSNGLPNNHVYTSKQCIDPRSQSTSGNTKCSKVPKRYPNVENVLLLKEIILHPLRLIVFPFLWKTGWIFLTAGARSFNLLFLEGNTVPWQQYGWNHMNWIGMKTWDREHGVLLYSILFEVIVPLERCV